MRKPHAISCLHGLTELRLSVPEAGRRLLPLPVPAWHATVGARTVDGIAKGDAVLMHGQLVRRFYDLGRVSVPRRVLGELLIEQRQREREARLAEELAEKVAAAHRTPVAAGVSAGEGLSAFETMVAQPGYQTIEDELGRPKPNFLLDQQLAEGHRREAAMRAEQEAVKRAQRVLDGRDE